MSEANRTKSFYDRVKHSLAGLGSSIIEARRMQAEYRRRHPGSAE